MFKQLHGEKHEIDHTLSIFANASWSVVIVREHYGE